MRIKANKDGYGLSFSSESFLSLSKVSFSLSLCEKANCHLRLKPSKGRGLNGAEQGPAHVSKKDYTWRLICWYEEWYNLIL
jgi:hypothetical protein